MKPVAMICFLILAFSGAWISQGCGGNENHTIVIEFPAPADESKKATETLWVYVIISGGVDATCQNLIDGIAYPDDTNYQVADKLEISNPFTANVRQLKVLNKDSSTLLFFIQGEDTNKKVVSRGCTEVPTGGASEVLISLNYTYTVAFDGDGATVEANPTTRTVTLPATAVGALPIEPTKNGYQFTGWWTAKNGGGTEFNTSTAVTESVTVYASWIAVPTITSFTIKCQAITARQIIQFDLEATDVVGVTGYLITESATKPTVNDAGWSATQTNYTLSAGYATKTVYAYAKNAVGNVSDGASITVNYVQPGTEDTTNWNKTVDLGSSSFKESVAVDSSGNVYVVGSGYNLVSGTSGLDWLIKKYSCTGVEDGANWNKTYDGGNDAAAYSVAVDSSGNVYVVGYGTNLVSGTSGRDWVIKKYSSAGAEDSTNWNKTFDGGYDDIATSVAVDSSGNVYVAGYKYNSGASGRDWLIKKYSSAGVEDTTNWNKTFDGGNDDYPTSITVDSSKNVFVVGVGYNLVSGASSYDWVIKKYSSAGAEDTTNWNKRFDGGNGGTDDFATSVAVDSSGNVFVVGYDLTSGPGGYDWLIKKYSSAGVEDWNKTFDGGNADFATSVAVDSSGNIYVVGAGYDLVTINSGLDWLIKKYSSTGVENISWNKTFNGGSEDDAYSVAVDSSGSVYVVGYGTNLVSGTSGYDWMIKKYYGE